MKNILLSITIIICLFLTFFNNLNAADFKLSEEKILNSVIWSKSINKNDYIVSNLTKSPVNNNLLCYTLTKKETGNEYSKLVIHNVETNKAYIIKDNSREINIRKNSRVTWHPSGKVIIFTAKLSDTIENLFSVRIYQENLSTKYSYRVYELVLIDKMYDEAINRDPCFNSDGSTLYYSRKDKDTDGFDIFYIEEFNEKLKSKKCGNLEYEILVEKENDQIFPIPSPIFDNEEDKQFLAYLSTDTENQVLSDNVGYKDYSLFLYDIEEEESYKINSSSGFEYYPFFWSVRGKTIFQLRATDLSPSNTILMDKRKNILNLYNYKILEADFSGYEFIPMSNGKTDILINNVNEKTINLPFMKDWKSFFISTYNDESHNSYSVKLFDYKRWLDRDNNFLIDYKVEKSVYPYLLDYKTLSKVLYLKGNDIYRSTFINK